MDAANKVRYLVNPNWAIGHHIALAVQLDLAAGADYAQTAGVAMVAAAVWAGGTAADGVMALRLFDESLSATRTEPQR
ncbi:hypothetical protein ACLMAJ_24450 [Nocardia sp. KC 131]|uniref:hypothetical protein n=1 Tax=Nocardia arseniciresistens TaxID=3392119 RepID=UPI00398E3E5C